MASGKQTVFRLEKRDSIDNLQSSQEPIPEIDGHEVLVRVRAVTLNFRDLAIATGKYPAPVKESVVPCSDAAGEVVKVGKHVLNLKEGDYVVGNFDVSNLYGPQQNMNNSLGGPLDGVLRQYIALPEIVLTRIPKSTSMNFLQMAALVCTGVTAWNALYGNNPLKPGQVVLFQGIPPLNPPFFLRVSCG
jgi:NADPH:quinone reductase-like Zn-dependent oxidoreductase